MSKKLKVSPSLSKILKLAGYKVGRRRRNACEFVHTSLPAVWIKNISIFDAEKDSFEAMEESWTEEVISLIEDTK